MCGAEAIVINRLLEHKIAREAEKIVASRITIVKMVWVLLAILLDLETVLGKGAIANLELVKVSQHILSLLLKICWAHGLQGLQI